MKNRIFISQTLEKIDQEVVIGGWVQTVRDHSKVLFLDLRDRSGLVQVVVFGQEMIKRVQDMNIGRESVVLITGTVKKRPDNLINPHHLCGTIEISCKDIEVLSYAQTPPFEIEDDVKADEELRMQYRYLDLRRPELLQRLRTRHSVVQFIRNWMTDHDFIEVETPVLTKDTPEGAREYLVPSRLYPGHGYALPQSPQQFKQLLMVAGFERYYQIAHLMRDEDPRADRQPEFTQLDLEMSFVDQTDVLNVVEGLFTDLVTKLMPEKHLTFAPFKQLTYDEAMEQYKSDKPDLRKDKNDHDEVGFAFVVDFPLFEKTKEGHITSAHHPFTSWKPTPENDAIMERVRKGESVSEEELLSIRANSYDIIANGYEIGSGSIRIHDPKKQEAIFKALKISDEKIEERFGHMLKAFSYGCPPHGGMAPGIERLMMVLTNQPNIREVIAFPKTGDGRDLMMNAPSLLSPEKLKDLHMKLDERPAK